ncbi:DNA helicase, phage associated [Bacillus sp. JCM 19046]|nr:DNA helicase, phage associated [Bacillus sp. JCM 19046]
MKQISSELKQLKQEVLARKQKRMTIKMRSFLTRLGQKRRSEALIKEITYWLDKYELEAYTSKKVPWHQVKMEQWLTFSEKRVNQSAREVLVKDQAEPLRLYVHQEQALRAINKQMHERFSGILSIPTGGGKTIVAVQWLLSHGIRNKRKVLWLAHRHDLLEQAYHSIETLAIKSLLSNRKSFTCRLISGHSEHDSITEVTAMDDVVIATCMSLANAIQLFTERWLREDEELLVIVDEAHHATANTYQVVLNELKRYANPKILGLTATPFRTIEEEKGLLKKSFRDDLIYKIDLRTLIARGILADPYFKEVKLNAGEPIYLTDLEKEQINHFDQLPERIASQLIDHKKRNDVIVKEYVSNKEAYGKTIVFAINRKHAVLLTVLFRAKGVRAAYVISQEKESNQHRDATLHQFKTNKLDVIINVNMLTEGTDLPDVQTVLLTRPTTSRILMTQMVGRALRGTEAGGTEKASIVYFQDNWHDTLTWFYRKPFM